MGQILLSTGTDTQKRILNKKQQPIATIPDLELAHETCGCIQRNKKKH